MVDFLKRRSGRSAAKKQAATAAGAGAQAAEVGGEDYAYSLHLRAKSGDSIRIAGRPDPVAELRAILRDVALSDVEILEPRPIELADAAPEIERPREAMQWLEAHRGNGAIARHALRIFETVGAIDLSVDMLACALLHGQGDEVSQPSYDAVVGGVASHWDEATGNLVMRAVVGWGGRSGAGETDRIAQRLLNLLQARIQAHAAG